MELKANMSKLGAIARLATVTLAIASDTKRVDGGKQAQELRERIDAQNKIRGKRRGKFAPQRADESAAQYFLRIGMAKADEAERKRKARAERKARVWETAEFMLRSGNVPQYFQGKELSEAERRDFALRSAVTGEDVKAYSDSSGYVEARKVREVNGRYELTGEAERYPVSSPRPSRAWNDLMSEFQTDRTGSKFEGKCPIPRTARLKDESVPRLHVPAASPAVPLSEFWKAKHAARHTFQTGGIPCYVPSGRDIEEFRAGNLPTSNSDIFRSVRNGHAPQACIGAGWRTRPFGATKGEMLAPKPSPAIVRLQAEVHTDKAAEVIAYRSALAYGRSTVAFPGKAIRHKRLGKEFEVPVSCVKVVETAVDSDGKRGRVFIGFEPSPLRGRGLTFGQ